MIQVQLCQQHTHLQLERQDMVLDTKQRLTLATHLTHLLPQRPPCKVKFGIWLWKLISTVNKFIKMQVMLRLGTNSGSTGTLPLSEEQIRASLLTAVEDKMRRRLREIFQQSQVKYQMQAKFSDCKKYLPVFSGRNGCVEANTRRFAKRKRQTRANAE